LGGTENINRIEILPTGELFLGIDGDGHAYYQYIYREAVGVYWEPVLKGFKSTELREWTPAQWYSHMVDIVRIGLGVELRLADKVTWRGVSDVDRTTISAN